MVNIVCVDDSLKIFASFFRPPPDALVHQDVVEDQVEQPIRENTRGHSQQIGVVHDLRGIVEQTDTGQAEHQRKQVVAFQGVSMNRVVGLVPAPQKSMHHIFVAEPGHEFPQQKGAGSDERAQYQGEEIHGRR